MMAEVKATAFSLRAAAWAVYVNAVVCRSGEEDWHTSWDLYRHPRGKWPSAYADLLQKIHVGVKIRMFATLVANFFAPQLRAKDRLLELGARANVRLWL